jgi:hypothetical protein
MEEISKGDVKTRVEFVAAITPPTNLPADAF